MANRGASQRASAANSRAARSGKERTPESFRTVSISSGDIGPKIKKLLLEEKNRLINNGADAMKNYLQHLQ